MEVIYHIKSEVSAVFLLNGSFVESAEKVVYRIGEPLYVTVLPLEAIYLPYTVKILKERALTNANLCESYCLTGDRYLVRLKPRYNYVYTPSTSTEPIPQTGLVPRFFKEVKERRFNFARECLTHELSATVTDDSLETFFAEYCDVAQNVYTGDKGWFLLKKEGEGALCKIEERSGLIDNFFLP